jgi:hypothetical protein
MHWCRHSSPAARLAVLPTPSAPPASTTSSPCSAVRCGQAQPQVCHSSVVAFRVLCILRLVIQRCNRGCTCGPQHCSPHSAFGWYHAVSMLAPFDTGLQAYETVTRLQSAADEVSRLSGFTFSTETRATRGFQTVKGILHGTCRNCAGTSDICEVLSVPQPTHVKLS